MAAQVRKKPDDLKFDCIVVDVEFHPKKDVIASGTIDGDIFLHSYSVTENNHELMTLTHHKKACRALRFSPDGQLLCSVSKDKSLQLVDLNTGTVKAGIAKAHKSAIYSLLVVDENIIVTGDDDGALKVWDMRQQKAVMDVKENEEFISDMILGSNKRLLVATSGDGTLTSFDIRKHKMKMQSELFDSELLSLASMKREGKVVCGTGDGVLNIFNWGEWGNLSDRFPGHPMSIDCMLPISDDIVCTGSLDGTIRAVNILPNRLLGVVGEHGDFPVENLSKSHCGHFLASCSHDQSVKFWDIKDLPNTKVDASKKVKKGKTKSSTSAVKNDDFFSDMLEDGSGEKKERDASSDDSDGSSDHSDSSDPVEGDLVADNTKEDSSDADDDSDSAVEETTGR